MCSEVSEVDCSVNIMKKMRILGIVGQPESIIELNPENRGIQL